jgi:DNA recombination protein RmuC
MLLVLLLGLQLVLLIAVAALYRRQPLKSAEDPRQLQLPDQLTRLEVQFERQLMQIRSDLGNEAATTRAANDLAAAALRGEVLSTISALTQTLTGGLETFRADNKTSGEGLRNAVQQTLESLTQRFSSFTSEAARTQLETLNTLNSRLADLALSNSAHQEKLRGAVEASLGALTVSNEAKLEQMRATVDEKLHATLHTRLTESFGQVTDQLNKVHTGLGEMSKLSEGVDDLSRIFSNVKSRGGFAEVQLGMLLEQMLAPSQFQRNACVKPGTQQIVEFAVRFPSNAGETLLPIDAKFPREDWERLESAYAANDPERIAACGRAFEASIRGEAKRICEKYINPPVTTPHAIMFLPTEGLYAEVMRRDSLQAEIQSKCQVTVAGPSTLSAILTSFQMGFHMLALQEKGDEVWKVLESAKTEFGKFGKLMDKVEGDVGKIQKTLGEVGVRTRAINRTLREVSDTAVNAPLEFEEFTPNTLRLAAVADED